MRAAPTVVVLVCLLVWAVLYAPELKRSAEAADVGTRRSVSLALLAPLVWVSDHVGLTAATDSAARLAGRDPNAEVGGVNVGVDPLPPVRPSSSAKCWGRWKVSSIWHARMYSFLATR